MSKENSFIQLFFKVKEANYKTNIQYDSNGVLGPGASCWVAGAIPHVRFKVSSSDPESSNVKNLEFNGFTNIQTGDLIKAYIPRYEEINGEYIGNMIVGGKGYETLLIEKKAFKETEKTSKIEKLSKEGYVLATFETGNFL